MKTQKEKKEILAIGISPSVIEDFTKVSGYRARSSTIESLMISFIKKRKKASFPQSRTFLPCKKGMILNV